MDFLPLLLFLVSLINISNFLLSINYQNTKISVLTVIVFVIDCLTLSAMRVIYSLEIHSVVIVLIASIIVAYVGFRSNKQHSRNILNNNSISESLEKLDVGVCYFTNKGLLKYCNEIMAELVYQIQGKDIQTYKEVADALVNPSNNVKKINANVFEFTNAKTYEFRKNEIIIHGKKYYQIIASDITNIVKIKQELDKFNNELEEMLKEVNYISNNIAEITRQQEILNAKIRIHNKMGNCLLAINEYLASKKDEEKRKLLVKTWQDSLNFWLDENKDDENPFEELIRIANSIGINVEIKGTMPKDDEISYLFMICLRECITNAKRHAKANKVIMDIQENDKYYIALFTNDGIKPTAQIKKGGGLSNLENKIKAKKGNMVINSFPDFSLRVELQKDIISLDI